MRCENKPLLQDEPGFLQEITSIAVEVGLGESTTYTSSMPLLVRSPPPLPTIPFALSDLAILRSGKRRQ
jgi:hypothetical protein